VAITIDLGKSSAGRDRTDTCTAPHSRLFRRFPFLYRQRRQRGRTCLFGGIYDRMPFSRDTVKWLLVVPTVPALLGIYSLQCLLRIEMFRMRFLFFVQPLLWTMSDAMRSLHFVRHGLPRS